jgi:hypothetical protein
MAYDNGRNNSLIVSDPVAELEAGVAWYNVLTRVVVGYRSSADACDCEKY